MIRTTKCSVKFCIPNFSFSSFLVNFSAALREWAEWSNTNEPVLTNRRGVQFLLGPRLIWISVAVIETCHTNTVAFISVPVHDASRCVD